MKARIFTPLIIAATAVSAPAYAGKFQDHDILDALVAARLGSEIGQPGGALAPVDRRLKLAQCPQTPKVSDDGTDAAIVRCDALGWRIRVPINVSAQNSRVRATSSSSARTISARYNPAQNMIAIRRGEPVRLSIRKRGFSLSRMMIADRNGRIGEVIPVRADRRESPIMVRVTDVGEASLMGR
ncbi:flagella basal body P-ring formation protein FlgA [Alterisphingorhabdus coralli]|uniref:Flagella basal body P-ring formation protein FlgA n=1 Tax=Alterisphingorhabdus coralli TaxID=3071408 RepID=A0AA97F5L7_9SPHN|nr:flagella basal body P-ring formation protein FlgA [Parasphingorhabdus sp. SCSIO 66989]WOE74754.1 flagella basal body P-ring formation protein FlgA [Parasphingorhabdus sp. SCSIO 66989]